MMNALLQTIDGLQEILGICPCCEDIFRLVDASFAFPKQKVDSCDYLELVKEEKCYERDYEKYARDLEEFNSNLASERRALANEGRASAKLKLKEIDSIFSANDIDPQDVKLVFHPVEYIIFHGLNSVPGTSSVEFISRAPTFRAEEITVDSIEKTLSNGDFCFETLRFRDDGTFEVKVA